MDSDFTKLIVVAASAAFLGLIVGFSVEVSTERKWSRKLEVVEREHKQEIKDLKQEFRIRHVECFYQSQEKDNYWSCMEGNK